MKSGTGPGLLCLLQLKRKLIMCEGEAINLKANKNAVLELSV